MVEIIELALLISLVPLMISVNIMVICIIIRECKNK